MAKIVEIEPGDFVTIVKGDNEGWTGILDNVFGRDGVETYAVIDECDHEVCYYATEIKLFAKAQ